MSLQLSCSTPVGPLRSQTSYMLLQPPFGASVQCTPSGERSDVDEWNEESWPQDKPVKGINPDDAVGSGRSRSCGSISQRTLSSNCPKAALQIFRGNACLIQFTARGPCVLIQLWIPSARSVNSDSHFCPVTSLENDARYSCQATLSRRLRQIVCKQDQAATFSSVVSMTIPSLYSAPR